MSEAKFEILRYLAELEEVSAKDLMKHVATRNPENMIREITMKTLLYNLFTRMTRTG